MFAPVFAVLLALSESPSPEPPPTPTPEAEIQHQIGDEEKRESTPVAQPVVVPTQNAGEAKHQRDNRDDKSSPDRTFKFDWGFLFAAVVAFAALATLITRIHQAVIARRQLRATQESAAAAVQTAQTNRISNRAKVVVESLRFVDVGDNNRAFYKVRNIGKAMAHIYERLDTVQMIAKPLPDGPPVLEGVPLNTDYFDLATDRDDVNFGGGMFATSDLDAANFTAETAEVYAFGVIKYRDDFGTEGTTEYAWQYRRNGPAFLVQQAGYNRST